MIYLADHAASSAEGQQVEEQAEVIASTNLQPGSSLRRLSRQSTLGTVSPAAAAVGGGGVDGGSGGGIRQAARFNQGYDRLE